MKSQFTRIVLAAGLTVLGSLALSAQDRQANAKIPFAFQVNHKSLPAGSYGIYRHDQAGLFRLGDNNGHAAFVSTYASDKKPTDEGTLTFACAQGKCVLSQIALPGSEMRYARSTSSVDSDMQRKLGMATMVNVRLSH
jgi:hypothetical protein